MSIRSVFDARISNSEVYIFGFSVYMECFFVLFKAVTVTIERGFKVEQPLRPTIDRQQ